MKKSNLNDLLKDVKDIEIELSKNLTKNSTMRLSATGDLVTLKSIQSLKEVLAIFHDKKMEYRIIGWGANQLLPETSEHPYLILSFRFDKSYLDDVHELYDLPASVSLSILSSHAIKKSLKGWEVFTGIPATLGGAIFMNAGTNLGEISKIVKDVTVISRDGAERIVKIDDNSFGYRKNYIVGPGEIIVSARLIHLGVDSKISETIKDYLALRNRTQPLKESTCGCIFKNYKTSEVENRAGLFIDLVGLKGFKFKNIQISPKHANFMVNLGDSGFEDMKETIDIVKSELKLHYGINFETEVKLD